MVGLVFARESIARTFDFARRLLLARGCNHGRSAAAAATTTPNQWAIGRPIDNGSSASECARVCAFERQAAAFIF